MHHIDSPSLLDSRPDAALLASAHRRRETLARMRVIVATFLTWGIFTMWPPFASAQMIDLASPDPVAVRLAELREDIRDERRDAGIALVTGGLLSVVGGGLVAAIGNADPFWLSFGVGSAGWGAINALLSLSLFDLGGGSAAQIEEDRALRGEALARTRERVIRAQHDSATLFAFNLGLDVFYVATGALLYFLADQIDGAEEQELLRGYAAAQIGQGAFLFAFDLAEWIGAASRADRLAELPIPR